MSLIKRYESLNQQGFCHQIWTADLICSAKSMDSLTLKGHNYFLRHQGLRPANLF